MSERMTGTWVYSLPSGRNAPLSSECRENGKHDWDDPQADSAICLKCGTSRKWRP